MSNNQMISVPREPTDEMIRNAMSVPVADTGNDEVDEPQDYRNLWKAMIDSAPTDQPQDEPVARYCMDQTGCEELDPEGPWVRYEDLPMSADPAEVERLREKADHLTEANRLLMDDCDTLRAEAAQHKLAMDAACAEIAERDALLQRALPYLSNTPDLVQHGAEDLAEEIRSASAGRPCYGPNEWGNECGKCSKCKPASAEPSAPVEREALHDRLLELHAAVTARRELSAKIRSSGEPPHTDYWHQSIDEAESRISAALSAIDLKLEKN